MSEAETGKLVRRRRSWYRRRLRVRRTLGALAVGLLIGGACWQNVARLLSLPSLHASQILPASFWSRANFHQDRPFATAASAKPAKFLRRIPGVYPYSVVPGGVKDLNELRLAASSDYVVRRHYSNFDFSRAKLIRLPETRDVFVSYRIRNTVFWTRKRIRLQPGELLLTDGKITARARCGNQISDTAKPEVSDEEPDADVLEDPVVAVNSASFMPVRPVLAAPDLPTGQPSPPALFAGGFVFPYAPVGLGPVLRLCPANDEAKDGHCIPKRHRKPIVPEPSSMLLLASGLAIIGWRYRSALLPAAA